MLTEDELEKAKATMADGISLTWKLYGNKPSDRLHSMLDEYPDISPEIWLDTLARIKDPQLVSYAVQYMWRNLCCAIYAARMWAM